MAQHEPPQRGNHAHRRRERCLILIAQYDTHLCAAQAEQLAERVEGLDLNAYTE